MVCELNQSLTLNGSHDVDPVIYVDVRRPTIERHPIELERRPEVRSVGTGSILILLLLSYRLLLGYFVVVVEFGLLIVDFIKSH